MVGLCRLELQTSSVSRKRSNQLSYRPVKGGVKPRLYHGQAPFRSAI